MKLVLVCFISAITFAGTCIHPGEADNQSLSEKSVTRDTIQFELQVMPIFVRRCSPCHFTGGVMYAKMPFDKSETIISHQAGILKRIKDEKENDLIRQFISQTRD